MRTALMLLILAGCAITPEQKAERAINRYGPYCEKLGFERGSDDWRTCIANQNASRRRGSSCFQSGTTMICS